MKHDGREASACEALKAGAESWKRWRQEHDGGAVNLRRADLSGANLSAADLAGVAMEKACLVNTNLRGAALSRASLSRSILRGCQLAGADLRGADLSLCDLRGADLERADLSHADLRGARMTRARLPRTRLTRANLLGANLYEAVLDGASLSETVLADVMLERATGLESCEHLGPSILDHRTLQRSGMLPLGFLRGCGLSDRLIDYLPSLLNEPIQYYSCFISYSTVDQAFAENLHANLQARGVRCWYAPEDMRIGAKMLDTVDEAIRLRDKVLLVISESSLASDWVEDEVMKAFAEERSRKQTVVFPIRIDDSIARANEPWATKLRENRHIGDFSGWKEHDAFRRMLERLLRDLRTDNVQSGCDRR